jgi:hypothetical protein
MRVNEIKRGRNIFFISMIFGKAKIVICQW